MYVIEDIKPLLNFEDEDTYYFLQIIQRRKDNNELKRESRIIKDYYINSIDYLDSHMDEIKSLCRLFNARAMLRLNRRSYRRTSLEMLSSLADKIKTEQYKSVVKTLSSAAGKYNNEPNKTWIVDIDEMEDMENYISDIKYLINSCQPVGNKEVLLLPTKSGFHLITKPFNLQEFSQVMKDRDLVIPDIHKDNPINLYIIDEK